MRFTDQQTEAPYGNNAAWMFNHFAGVGISTANQDRNVWMNTQTPANDSAARYGVENLQAETDFNCNGCTITGSPDGDVETGSFQLSDNMLTNPSPAGGIQTLRVNYTRTATAAAYFSGASAVNATWGPGSATGFTGGSIGNVYYAQCQNNSASTIPNLTCAAFDALFPANPNHYANGQIALWNRSSGSYTPGANDFIIRSDILGETTALNGPVLFTALQSSNGGSAALTGTASLNLTGGFATTQASALPTPTGTCSGGASTYTYELVGVDVNGGLVPGSIAATNASCTNPLTSGNPVTLSISLSSAAIEPFIRIDVYRTGGPMGTGKIGSLTCQQNGAGPNCNTFSDTGLTASGSAPTVNSTGTLAVAGALISNGTAAALTGTGACATITTQTGGAFAGSAKCTGTTGASTLTITPGLTAPNGWSCNVQDETTRANAFQQTSHTTTTCVLTVTSVTANDVFVFSALAF
jgi:hypothetical protein